MGDHKAFTLPQVAQHKFRKDCWIVVGGRVVDVTNFLDEHPGGDDILLGLAGKDATKNFEAIGHSKEAEKLLVKYQVGVLQGFSFKGENSYMETKGGSNEMTAFVIKEDSSSKFTALIEVVVPLILAISVFGYRYLYRDTQLLN